MGRGRQISGKFIIIFSLSQHYYLEIIEGTLGSNAVNQDKSLAILHIQISHGCKLFLEKNINIPCNGFLEIDFP